MNKIFLIVFLAFNVPPSAWSSGDQTREVKASCAEAFFSLPRLWYSLGSGYFPSFVFYQGHVTEHLPRNFKAYSNARGIVVLVSLRGFSHQEMVSYVPPDSTILGGTRYQEAKPGLSEGWYNSVYLREFDGLKIQRENFDITVSKDDQHGAIKIN